VDFLVPQPQAFLLRLQGQLLQQAWWQLALPFSFSRAILVPEFPSRPCTIHRMVAFSLLSNFL
jgi:hypothetical protein